MVTLMLKLVNVGVGNVERENLKRDIEFKGIQRCLLISHDGIYRLLVILYPRLLQWLLLGLVKTKAMIKPSR